MRKQVSLLVFSTLSGALLMAGCPGKPGQQAVISGTAKFSNGVALSPQQKNDDLKIIEVGFQGEGTTSRCPNTSVTFSQNLDVSKSAGSATVQANGAYGQNDAMTFPDQLGGLNPSNCGPFYDADAKQLTNVTVTASVPANNGNCEAYCQGSSSPTTCQHACGGSGKIIGTGTISSADLQNLNKQLQDRAAVLNARVNIVFGTLE